MAGTIHSLLRALMLAGIGSVILGTQLYAQSESPMTSASPAGEVTAEGTEEEVEYPTPPPSHIDRDAFVKQATSQSQGEFRQQIDQDVGVMLQQIELMAQNRTYASPYPVSHETVIGPEGWTALLIARPTPQGRRWFTTLSREAGKIDQAYDFLVAADVRSAMFNPTGDYLAIHAGSESPEHPSGKLVVIATRPRRATIIDDEVTRYSMSPDGRYIVYVRLKEPEALDGERAIILLDGMSGERTVLKVLEFPRQQITAFGDWESEPNRIGVDLVDYSKGLLGAKLLHGVIHVAEGTLELN